MDQVSMWLAGSALGAAGEEGAGSGAGPGAGETSEPGSLPGSADEGCSN